MNHTAEPATSLPRASQPSPSAEKLDRLIAEAAMSNRIMRQIRFGVHAVAYFAAAIFAALILHLYQGQVFPNSMIVAAIVMIPVFMTRYVVVEIGN